DAREHARAEVERDDATVLDVVGGMQELTRARVRAGRVLVEQPAEQVGQVHDVVLERTTSGVGSLPEPAARELPVVGAARGERRADGAGRDRGARTAGSGAEAERQCD